MGLCMQLVPLIRASPRSSACPEQKPKQGRARRPSSPPARISNVLPLLLSSLPTYGPFGHQQYLFRSFVNEPHKALESRFP